jgi:hydroxyacylglutathione hydrolase
MIFKRIEAEGLAHYSYLIGDGRDAAVIDPKRDCDIYREEAHPEGFRIRHIIETHRHEDFILGSVALASQTGAEIWHADDQLPYQYGNPVENGQTWKIGRLKLTAISSPGHTLGSMSYLLHDPEGAPWIVFSGDALFAGDVGRVDFMGMDRASEMAGYLYDTLFDKLLPLGDGVIVCPAHGSGSVCAGDIGERMWTTIGMERLYNPKLQVGSRRDFIDLVARKLDYPPYFRQMEEVNLKGAPTGKAYPVPMSVDAFAGMAQEGVILDTRMELGFSASHVPNALSIWSGGLPGFAGWFLPYDKPIVLVHENNNPEQVVRYLLRLGYDNLAGYLSGGMLAWQMAGREISSIGTVSVPSLCTLLDEKKAAWLLDVRSDTELEYAGQITGAHHIHLTELLNRMSEVPKNRTIHIFCGSGLRSMIAASLLKREGWWDIVVVLGGLAGWKSVSCPLRSV